MMTAHLSREREGAIASLQEARRDYPAPAPLRATGYTVLAAPGRPILEHEHKRGHGAARAQPESHHSLC